MSIPRNKICDQLVVRERIQETNNTISLVFDIPLHLREKFRYKSGQFVTLFMDIDNEEIRRSYSIPSSPEWDESFKISVKLVPGGKGSTYLLNTVKKGDKLWVTPPAGLFCLPDNYLDYTALAFYAAGSGITPIVSLIKTALKASQVRCVLVYQNKNLDSVIFSKEIAELKNLYPDRFAVEHVLSCPDSTWQGLCGRIDVNFLKAFLIRQTLGIRTLHFLCGPEGFMDTIANSLQEMGFEKNKVIRESFYVNATSNAKNNELQQASVDSFAASGDAFVLDKDCVRIGNADSLSSPKIIEAIIDGETHLVPFMKNTTILETLLEAGLNPPYSCLDGACMACLGKVEEGYVYQDDMGILTDDNVDAKECLTCQARPASGTVKINYDAL